MNSTRRIAITAGALFILATVSSLTAAALLPTLTGAGYLTGVANHSDKVATASLLYLIAAAGSVGIAVAIYPVLKQLDAALALGSVVFRTVEAVFYTAGVVSLLSILSIGQKSATASATDRAAYEAIGDSLVAAREHAAVAAVLAFSIGALMYYLVFYRSRLIPRWLSGWGIAAMPLMMIACLLALFNDSPVTGYVLLALPIGVQEMVFAVWLLVKGFRPTARPPSVSAASPTTTTAVSGGTIEPTV